MKTLLESYNSTLNENSEKVTENGVPVIKKTLKDKNVIYEPDYDYLLGLTPVNQKGYSEMLSDLNKQNRNVPKYINKELYDVDFTDFYKNLKKSYNDVTKYQMYVDAFDKNSKLVGATLRATKSYEGILKKLKNIK